MIRWLDIKKRGIYWDTLSPRVPDENDECLFILYTVDKVRVGEGKSVCPANLPGSLRSLLLTSKFLETFTSRAVVVGGHTVPPG